MMASKCLEVIENLDEEVVHKDLLVWGVHARSCVDLTGLPFGAIKIPRGPARISVVRQSV